MSRIGDIRDYLGEAERKLSELLESMPTHRDNGEGDCRCEWCKRIVPILHDINNAQTLADEPLVRAALARIEREDDERPAGRVT